MNVTTCGTIIGFFRGLHVTEHRFQNLAPESDELVRAALSRSLNHHTIAPIPRVLLAETPGACRP
jgi:hypothetical protein